MVICFSGRYIHFIQVLASIGIKSLVIFSCDSKNFSCLQLCSLCVYTRICMCMCVHICTDMSVHVCTHAYTMCICVCVYLCMYSCSHSLFLGYSCQKPVHFIKLSRTQLSIISLFFIFTMSIISIFILFLHLPCYSFLRLLRHSNTWFVNF